MDKGKENAKGKKRKGKGKGKGIGRESSSSGNECEILPIFLQSVVKKLVKYQILRCRK